MNTEWRRNEGEFVQSFIHSLVRSFIHSFVHSFVRSFIRSFVHSFVHSFIYSFIHSFVRSFVRLFIHSFVRSFVHSFDHSFIFVIHWINSLDYLTEDALEKLSIFVKPGKEQAKLEYRSWREIHDDVIFTHFPRVFPSFLSSFFFFFSGELLCDIWKTFCGSFRIGEFWN